MTTVVAEPADSLPFQRLDGALLLGTVIAPFLLLWFQSKHLWIVTIPLGVVLVHFWRRSFALFARAAFWPMFFVALLLLPWPLAFIVPLSIYLVIYAVWPTFRRHTHWLVLGRFTKVTVYWTVPTILSSCGGLLAWVFLFRPDLSDLARMVPPGGPMMLLSVGAAFSVFNAIWEEFILKGIAWNSLEVIFRRDWAINSGQAALFGVMHIGGFPRGWIGVLMAAAYGLVVGIIRRESRGLLAPIVTHMFADATIFLILYFITAGTLAVK